MLLYLSVGAFCFLMSTFYEVCLRKSVSLLHSGKVKAKVLILCFPCFFKISKYLPPWEIYLDMKSQRNKRHYCDSYSTYFGKFFVLKSRKAAVLPFTLPGCSKIYHLLYLYFLPWPTQWLAEKNERIIYLDVLPLLSPGPSH